MGDHRAFRLLSGDREVAVSNTDLYSAYRSNKRDDSIQLVQMAVHNVVRPVCAEESREVVGVSRRLGMGHADMDPAAPVAYFVFPGRRRLVRYDKIETELPAIGLAHQIHKPSLDSTSFHGADHVKDSNRPHTVLSLLML